MAHGISALTAIGYENLRYSGLPPIRIDDVVWGIGARWEATPTRVLSVLYGRRNGITGPTAALRYELTPLTRIAASYSDNLSTFSQDIEQNLAISDLDQSRQTVDAPPAFRAARCRR